MDGHRESRSIRTVISSRDLDSPVGVWVAAMVPRMLPDPYGYKIVPGNIDNTDVLGSMSRISKAADIWMIGMQILKRNNWNSFAYKKSK